MKSFANPFSSRRSSLSSGLLHENRSPSIGHDQPVWPNAATVALGAGSDPIHLKLRQALQHQNNSTKPAKAE